MADQLRARVRTDEPSLLSIIGVLYLIAPVVAARQTDWTRKPRSSVAPTWPG
jgi:hypothetical protein